MTPILQALLLACAYVVAGLVVCRFPFDRKEGDA
jgi:hypothetical protein